MTGVDNLFAYDNWISKRYSIEKTTDQIENGNPDFFVDLQIVFQDPSQFKAQDFFNYQPQLIFSYLENTHRFYLTSYLEEIQLAIDRLPSEEPFQNNLKEGLKLFFQKLKSKLIAHIEEEEKHLYPYVSALIKASQTGEFTYNPIDKIELISFLMDHDDQIEEGLHLLVKKLEKMVPDNQESFAFRMMVTKIKLFELDLRIHGWMEELVMVPMAMKMEQKILTS